MHKGESVSETQDTTRLFVYGTLKPGFANYVAITSLVRSSCLSRTQGILVDLGAFPAMVDGEGFVEGILLEVEPAAIEIADRIEGFHGERDCSLYVRREVECQLHGGSHVGAWTYFFAAPEKIGLHQRCLVSEEDGIPVFRWPVESTSREEFEESSGG